MPRSACSLPAPLAKAAARFETWRRRRKTRRIPEDLWSLAATLGGRYGVSRTASALRVQYYDLRKRVVALGTPSAESGPSPTFVEVVPGPSTARPECVVELESVSGTKVRIHASGAGIPNLAELVGLFLEQEG
jgi:hypothetical protein